MLGRLGLVFYIFKLVSGDIYDEYNDNGGYDDDSYSEYNEGSSTFGPKVDPGRVRRFGEVTPPATRNLEEIRGALEKILPDHVELFQDLTKRQIDQPLTEIPSRITTNSPSFLGPPSFETGVSQEASTQPSSYEDTTVTIFKANSDVIVKRFDQIQDVLTTSWATDDNVDYTEVSKATDNMTANVASETSLERTLNINPLKMVNVEKPVYRTTFVPKRVSWLPERPTTSILMIIPSIESSMQAFKRSMASPDLTTLKMDSDIFEENNYVPLLYDKNITKQDMEKPEFRRYGDESSYEDDIPIARDSSTTTGTTTSGNGATTSGKGAVTSGKGSDATQQAATKCPGSHENVTTSKYKVYDIETFLTMLKNLTADDNITDLMNVSLRNNTPTCADKIKTTPLYETPDELDNVIIAKCFVCGLNAGKIPKDTNCADAFAGDFLPLTPFNPVARSRTSSFRKYCRYKKSVFNYFENSTRPKSIYGRWTGGCSVRWTDLTGLYTQRACRNRKFATSGHHYASKRMAKLEMALMNTEKGCIISPVATLLPISRGISLYARFHACVCTGNWCNAAGRHLATMAHTLAVVLLWLCRFA